MVKTFVRIKKGVLFQIFKNFEKRSREPGFKYHIPDDDTVIEFNSFDGNVYDADGAKDFGDAPFACYDDEKNILYIQ